MITQISVAEDPDEVVAEALHVWEALAAQGLQRGGETSDFVEQNFGREGESLKGRERGRERFRLIPVLTPF